MYTRALCVLAWVTAPQPVAVHTVPVGGPPAGMAFAYAQPFAVALALPVARRGLGDALARVAGESCMEVEGDEGRLAEL